MQIRVYLNGHEWLERKLHAQGISFTKQENVFLRIADAPHAQKLTDRSSALN
jgi:hypothetical protein